MAAAALPLSPQEIEATRCRACHYLHAPARTFRCLSCGGRDLDPTRVALVGTIETFTLQKGAHGTLGLALVHLDAGPLVTAVVELDAGLPQLGARVQGAVEQVPAGDLDRTVRRLRFRLAPGVAPKAAVATRRPEVPR